VAYNAATGAKLWQATYNPGTGYLTELSSITISPGGSTVFVTGVSGYVLNPGYTGLRLLTVAYNAATGAVLWQATGSTLTGGLVWPVAVSPDGSTVFAGSPDQTVAYNAATGALLWTQPVAGAAITVSADSKTVFVTGGTGLPHTPTMTEALNATTGAQLWQAEYATGPRISTRSTSIGLSPDGSTVFVAGTAHNLSTSQHPQLFTAAFNAATGAQAWADPSKPKRPGSSLNGLTVDPSGSAVFVAEGIQGAGNINYQVTAALNPATGATLWHQVVHATSGTSTWTGATPYALTASPSGATVYVTGDETMKPPSGLRPLLGYLTIAYNAATGHTRWTAVYQHRSEDIPNAIRVSPDGSRIFVTGVTARAYPEEWSGNDIETVAYGS
jgi:outer membrane protein assembly factor BamB